jgi:hypothetical protein
MNFFKMRIVNTFLVLLIGIVLGSMIKDRPGARRGSHDSARKSAGYGAPLIAAPEGENTDFSAYNDPPEKTGTRSAPAADKTSVLEDFELPMSLPAGKEEDSSSGREEGGVSREEADPGEDNAGQADGEKAGGVLRGAEEDFFRNPKRFSGQDLEMELQMLTAAKRQKGWLINLARVKGGKSSDYLYIEDESVLGENPDLKIGFFYRTRFRCRKGDPAAGNTLLGLTPTGNKAAWATGISAIE